MRPLDQQLATSRPERVGAVGPRAYAGQEFPFGVGQQFAPELEAVPAVKPSCTQFCGPMIFHERWGYTDAVKSLPSWLSYTLLRLIIFVIPLALLLAVNITPWIAGVVASLFALSASLIFLRQPRESLSTTLYEVRHRKHPEPATDDLEEDAAVEATSDSHRANTTPNPTP